MNYTQTVLASFKEGNRHTIAGLNEMLSFKVNHPISIIRELRKKGHNIVDEWVSKNGCRYKVYSLEVDL